jgi:hypothetical protein
MHLMTLPAIIGGILGILAVLAVLFWAWGVHECQQAAGNDMAKSTECLTMAIKTSPPVQSAEALGQACKDGPNTNCTAELGVQVVEKKLEK